MQFHGVKDRRISSRDDVRSAWAKKRPIAPIKTAQTNHASHPPDDLIVILSTTGIFVATRFTLQEWF